MTEEPLVFTHWSELEPNHVGGEDAVTLYELNDDWNALNETALRPFIVEFDPDSRPDSIFIDGVETKEW